MNIKRKIYLLFGSLFFSLGLLGYYIPVMPGTVFMILAAYCFMNSSNKLYNKITSNPIYGKAVKQYIEYHVIPVKAKIMILLSIWIATLATVYLAPQMRYIVEFYEFNIILNAKVIGLSLSVFGSIVVLRAKNY